jgi:hypothetical protein
MNAINIGTNNNVLLSIHNFKFEPTYKEYNINLELI